MKKAFSLIFAFVMILSLSACQTRELSANVTAYYVVYSGLSDSKGRVEGIDVDGNATAIHDIDAINISKGSLVGENFIAGGHRANNHLIMQKDGSFEEFYLLDNPQYSGVWGITLDGDNIVSVMNGNVDDEKNVYLNLLVIQDMEHNVLAKKEIDITPDSLLVDGDFLYMAGCFWQYDTNPIYCGASIARYNMKTGEYKEKHFPYNPEEVTATSYTSLAKHGDYLYCTVRESFMDKEATDRQEKIDIIDGKMFELVDSLPFDQEISEIHFVDDDLYLIVANKLCKYDMDTRIATELYTLSENMSVESSLSGNGHIYYYVRCNPALKVEKMLNIGYIIDFNTADESVKGTPLTTDAKNTESIVFFPLDKS